MVTSNKYIYFRFSFFCFPSNLRAHLILANGSCVSAIAPPPHLRWTSSVGAGVPILAACRCSYYSYYMPGWCVIHPSIHTHKKCKHFFFCSSSLWIARLFCHFRLHSIFICMYTSKLFIRFGTRDRTLGINICMWMPECWSFFSFLFFFFFFWFRFGCFSRPPSLLILLPRSAQMYLLKLLIPSSTFTLMPSATSSPLRADGYGKRYENVLILHTYVYIALRINTQCVSGGPGL